MSVSAPPPATPKVDRNPVEKLSLARLPRSRRALIASGAILLGILGGTGINDLGIAQSSAAPTAPTISLAIPSSIHNAEILSHLNATIHFYRRATGFTQKIGEPSDGLFHDEAITLSTQIAQLAFQSAKAEAALLNPENAPAKTAHHAGSGSKDQKADDAGQSTPPNRTETTQQKQMSDLMTSTHAHIAELKASIAGLDHQIAIAPASKLAALTAQRDNLQGQLDLTQSMHEALDKYQDFANANSVTHSALGDDIARLELSAPILSPLAASSGMPSAAPSAAATRQQQVTALSAQSLHNAQGLGVMGQAEAVFSELSNLHDLTDWMKENNQLRAQAAQLHAPLVALLRQTLQQGQTLAQSATPAASAPAAPPAGKTSGAKATRQKIAKAAVPAPAAVSSLEDYEELAKRFQQISSASLPLSQEILLLDQSHANLQQWRDSIDREYDELLRALLVRMIEIALSFGLVLLFGEVWRRASIKYIQDLRRRRQLLIIRKFIMGFFMCVVLTFGFVSQISSLATFAGFLTAGIAVGLQTILLSVAAYFFIVGRFGVRVGDRISVAGVTGDVMEVGLVRMYVMELAGTGIDLYPTGRVAVFSNAVLFQATTPLYKQIPGTEYGWREVAVKLNEAADFKGAAEKITALVTDIYKKYQPEIERQHGSLAIHWDISAETPKVESRLQYVDGGLEFKVRFPILLRHAAESDEAITRALVSLSQSDGAFQTTVQGLPVLRTAVKV